MSSPIVPPPRSRALTGRHPIVVDEIQCRHHERPCFSGAWEHQIIRIDDLAADGRWPRYRQEALHRTPIRSILSFRLFTDRQTAGVLNLYAEQTHTFDDESVEVGLAFATHTALTCNILRRDEQFRTALASRDVIGQAKGILMETFGIDAIGAFDLLKRLSQESNTPVTDIAHRLAGVDRPRSKPSAP
jgi:GAF domain-containing protein